ncbi:RidA family protein [Donghicola mangrovi]|uniref:RidA family protein n=1 Tax=Donghicola mangrovi TaxID=2729614 RepID=A0A850QF24_9RHOB|nr:RidA family protein [Donghicola mangrovi]NVO25560.1 RidA family protein [Donghicola mangrovi]
MRKSDDIRQSIYIDGMRHKNPVPVASRIGQMVYSGGIHGYDPDLGRTADGFPRQCELMFRHVHDTIIAAGGTPDDIIKMTLWMHDRSHETRALINPYWEALFPDPQSRPTRHALQTSELGSGMLIQCDFIAILRPEA